MAASFIDLLIKKKGFLTAVYATLIVQVAISFAVIYKSRSYPELFAYNFPKLMGLFVLSLMLVLAITLVAMPMWTQFVLFMLLSLVLGAILSFIASRFSLHVVRQALISAVSVFAMMTVVGVVLAALGIDLSFMLFVLLIALLAFILATVVIAFTGPQDSMTHKVMVTIGIVIFSLYVAVHTNMMLQKNYGQNFIQGALDLYLAFINLFSLEMS